MFWIHDTRFSIATTEHSYTAINCYYMLASSPTTKGDGRPLAFPNSVCLLLSSSALPRVKKNWLPLSLGPPLAIATRPRRMNLSRE